VDFADILIEWHHTVNDGFPIHFTGEPKLIDGLLVGKKEKTL
jgi:hypothetical protein